MFKGKDGRRVAGRHAGRRVRLGFPKAKGKHQEPAGRDRADTMQSLFEMGVHSQDYYLSECDMVMSHDEIGEALRDQLENMPDGVKLQVGQADMDTVKSAIGMYGRYIKGRARREKPDAAAEFMAGFWRKILGYTFARLDNAWDRNIRNIALDFTDAVVAGRFDGLDEFRYSGLVDACTRLSSDVWHDKPAATLSDMFPDLIKCMAVPDGVLDDIAKAFAGCGCSSECDVDCDCDAVVEESHLGESRTASVSSDDMGVHGLPVRPKAIFAELDRCVKGQDEAKRAAAMAMWHHLNGSRTNVVFCGPSGCGKSEIWRVLAKRYPGHVRMVDASRLSADGWRGSFHIRDIFDGLDPKEIRDSGLVVVLDEADKIVCEHAIGAGGTDYNALVQTNLLKMMDGDVIEFGKDDDRRKSAMRIDCARVSVVMLGAFENLVKMKNARGSGIGFGNDPRADRYYDGLDVTFDDLVEAGMRREIAGRVNRIAMLRPLERTDYEAILREFVVPGLSEGRGFKVKLDGKYADGLVGDAMKSKLGVRWMRSELGRMLDGMLFEDPDKKEYFIA